MPETIFEQMETKIWNLKTWKLEEKWSNSSAKLQEWNRQEKKTLENTTSMDSKNLLLEMKENQNQGKEKESNKGTCHLSENMSIKIFLWTKAF